MRILGVSCYFHDAAACLYEDGRIVAAAEEERFTRFKHDARFPAAAIAYCLEAGGVAIEDLDHVIFYEKPLAKFQRILASCIDGAPYSLRFFVAAMETWLADKLWVPATFRSVAGWRGRLLYAEHHLSHAASGYLLSPFDEAAVVTADGVGERTTTTIGVGEGGRVRLLKEIHFPHSLGLLYSALTAYLGFEVNEGEYKVMGMAAYGRPRHADAIRRLLRLGADGSFRLDTRYFRYQCSLGVWCRALEELLGPPRAPDASLDERHLDIAASLQSVLEDAVVGLADEAHRLTGSRRLALAGGVALNVLANRQILRRTPFRQLFVPPGPGDSGAAIGAAAYLAHTVLGAERVALRLSPFLGPEYDAPAIRTFLRANGIPFDDHPDEDAVLERVAALVAGGRVVGWFCGRMEFGPRALGARSILADPTNAAMKDIVNVKVKHREPFRPFGPSVLLEAAPGLFVEGDESPYMTLTTNVLPEQRERIPAVVHADGTVRLQTVTRDANPVYYRLIERIGSRIGVPAVLNTSFNLRGEPIVRSPEDAFRCFSATEIDALVLWPYLLTAEAKRELPLREAEQQAHETWLA